MNYQYRHGTTTKEALVTLYKDGGVRRFYRGLGPALIQGPLSRFGDTAANSGIMALMESNENCKNLPVAIKTLAASFTAACWRICLMPVDTLKTSMQVNGATGVSLLGQRMKAHGFTTLYYGAIAASAATFVGHYPWFVTYNYLNSTLPKYDELHKKLTRSAIIGFTSSVVSDTCSNSIRVIKTYRQTHSGRVSYAQAVGEIVAKDGMLGLFGRGLKTRLITNGLQGLMFTIIWKLLEDQLNRKT